MGGNEEPDDVIRDPSLSAATPKPMIKARDVNLTEANDGIAKMRDSMSELIPDAKD